jgi:hypothetical protein
MIKPALRVKGDSGSSLEGPLLIKKQKIINSCI